MNGKSVPRFMIETRQELGSYTGLVKDELLTEKVILPLSTKNQCGYEVMEEVSPNLCMSPNLDR